MTSKVLVAGPVNGKFKEVFQKISTLHTKNAFAFALVVGDLFQDPLIATSDDEADVEALLNGQISVPVATYFTVGRHPLPLKIVEKIEEGSDDVCDNLVYVGKRATFKTSAGIRLVTLGGKLDPDLTVGTSKDRTSPFYSTGDASTLKGAASADILVTGDWPTSVRLGSELSAQSDDVDPPSHQCIADLNVALRPRYHFSTSTKFFEREPFFHPALENEQKAEYSVTRFISLAPYGNPSKQKWVYAFSVDTTTKTTATIPPGATASPFTFMGKKRAAPPASEFSRFDRQHDEHHHGRGKKRMRHAPPGPGECFFCLSNPNLAAHLVTSIGTDAYLTTAKGPISNATTFGGIPFPCHMLIIPLAHAPTLRSIPDVSTRESTIAEMRCYRNSLNAMVHARSRAMLGTVTWEVRRSSGIHTHWQYLPLSADTIKRGLVEAAFKVEAQNEGYPAIKVSDGGSESLDSGMGDSFTVTTWRAKTDDTSTAIPGESGGNTVDLGGVERLLEMALDSSFRFDLQFGRRVLCKLLNLETRTNWRDCAQTEVEETADAEAFKEVWKDYDFTAE